jgi:amidase
MVQDVTDAQFVQASQFRERFRQHLAALLGDDGVLVLPTMPDIAPLRSADEASLEAYRNNAVQMLCIAGLSGFPDLAAAGRARGRRWASRCWDRRVATAA